MLFKYFVWLIVWCFPFTLSQIDKLEDRLSTFYQRLTESDVKYCPDRTKLLPSCTECIPGLTSTSGSSTCNEYIASSKAIRDEIRKLVVERVGENQPKERYYGLYPCKPFAFHLLHIPNVLFHTIIDLEKPDFVIRQIKFGEILSKAPIKNLIDIGAYYNPIHLFFTTDLCPESVIIIEPILDALSAMVPCKADPSKSTHYLILPVTFKYYAGIKSSLPMPETVVCIGCDSHYGPNRKMLETTFDRPYKLYIEYPSEYVHNAPFRKMMGKGPGETLEFHDKYQANTNETRYTKRVMKIISYV